VEVLVEAVKIFIGSSSVGAAALLHSVLASTPLA
jgi:hypothetical protein